MVHRARTALRFLPTLSYIFHIFSGWQGRGGLRGKHTTTEASTPSSSPMVVVAAHTPCQGRAVGRGRRGCRTLWYVRSTEEPSAPQGAQACGAVSNVSRFAVLNALVSRFGVLLSRSHGTRAHHKGGANSGEVQKTAQGERKGCTRTWKTNAPRAHRVVHRAHRAYISLNAKAYIIGTILGQPTPASSHLPWTVAGRVWAPCHIIGIHRHKYRGQWSLLQYDTRQTHQLK